MKRDTVIGIALIGLILIGFSIYNNRQYTKQLEAKRIQDSIAYVRAQEYVKEQAALANSEVKDVNNEYSYTYENTLLEQALNEDSSVYELSNDKVSLSYTTRGAQLEKAVIKDYYTYDSLELALVKPEYSNFNIQLFVPYQINTSGLNYRLAERTDSSLVFRLYFDEDSYVQHKYTLPQDSYMVDFDFSMVGMENFIPKNVTGFDASWDLKVPRLERGYKNEKNYSSISYKYPNDSSVEDLGFRKNDASEHITTKLEWFAFQQQFFSAIFLAENSFSAADLSYKFYGENDAQKRLMNCSAKVNIPVDMSDNVNVPLKFYFGPNHFNTLKSYDYDFEGIVPLGSWVVRWINRWCIIPVFDFLSKYIASYGLIILLLTVLVKLVISPLTIKSYTSSAKMRIIKPEIDKINAKYPKPEDAMKKQQEMMDLYRRSGISMFGGCLPMLIQFPILIAMFRFFPASFELRQQKFLWADDLSSYDSILDFGFNIPLFGDHLSLFALLMAVSMFLYSKMTQSQMDTSAPGMGGMKFMMVWLMPIMMLFICNNFSSGLSYYYMLSNIFTILQTWVIRKYFVSEEKVYAKLRANSAKAAAKPKSKMQLRLEAIAKAQQEAARQNRK